MWPPWEVAREQYEDEQARRFVMEFSFEEAAELRWPGIGDDFTKWPMLKQGAHQQGAHSSRGLPQLPQQPQQGAHQQLPQQPQHSQLPQLPQQPQQGAQAPIMAPQEALLKLFAAAEEEVDKIFAAAEEEVGPFFKL